MAATAKQLAALKKARAARKAKSTKKTTAPKAKKTTAPKAKTSKKRMTGDAKTLVSSCGTTLKSKRLKGGYKLVTRKNKL